MLVGVALFVGGMVALLFLSKFFNQNEPVATAQRVVLRPVETKNEAITFMQDTESVTLLRDIRDELKIEKPEGHVFNMSLDVTSQITDLYDQARHKMPWSKVDIINMGPSPIYFCVNKWDWSEAPIEVGLSVNVDFQKKDSISRLFLKCDNGLNSNVRLQIVK